MRFRFIDAERAGLAMPKFGLCRLLQVSVSGFHAWRNRGPSQRQLDDMVLLAHVRAAFRRSRESYGAERVHHELAENGIEVGRHGVARLMRGNGLSPKRKQKFKKTTDSQHNKAVALNLLDQNFSAEAANEKWAADISYIWTAQGWLYLAVMLDLYSRRVIGWAVCARMTSDLPLRALNRAIGLRQPGAGVIHHSDRGSQGEFNRSWQFAGVRLARRRPFRQERRPAPSWRAGTPSRGSELRGDETRDGRAEGDLSIAVDFGGTFTDVVGWDGHGFHVAKVATRPERPADGVAEGIDLQPGAVVRFVHSTTETSRKCRLGDRINAVMSAVGYDFLCAGSLPPFRSPSLRRRSPKRLLDRRPSNAFRKRRN